MRLQYLTLSLICCFQFPCTVNAQSIVGNWKTIDDVSGEAKSVLTIKEADGVYSASVAEILDPEVKDINPLCLECPGDKRNTPIKGLDIMWDVKSTGKSKWGKGKIMDPENGKVYGCKLSLMTKDKLKVRGFIGFAALGRNQYWYRVHAPE